jgi:hypothetical protein
LTKRRACLLASWAFFYELSVKLPRLNFFQNNFYIR